MSAGTFVSIDKFTVKPTEKSTTFFTITVEMEKVNGDLVVTSLGDFTQYALYNLKAAIDEALTVKSW